MRVEMSDVVKKCAASVGGLNPLNYGRRPEHDTHFVLVGGSNTAHTRNRCVRVPHKYKVSIVSPRLHCVIGPIFLPETKPKES